MSTFSLSWLPCFSGIISSYLYLCCRRRAVLRVLTTRNVIFYKVLQKVSRLLVPELECYTLIQNESANDLAAFLAGTNGRIEHAQHLSPKAPDLFLKY
jgi:hypothetical protein